MRKQTIRTCITLTDLVRRAIYLNKFSVRFFSALCVRKMAILLWRKKALCALWTPTPSGITERYTSQWDQLDMRKILISAKRFAPIRPTDKSENDAVVESKTYLWVYLGIGNLVTWRYFRACAPLGSIVTFAIWIPLKKC